MCNSSLVAVEPRSNPWIVPFVCVQIYRRLLPGTGRALVYCFSTGTNKKRTSLSVGTWTVR